MTKDDLYIEFKWADVHLVRGDNDFLLIWYDKPAKGKSITVEYIPANYPSLTVIIKSNSKAKRDVRKCLSQLGYEESKYRF